MKVDGYNIFFSFVKSSGCLGASLSKIFCKTLLYTSIVKEKLMRQKAYNTKMSDAHINEHIYMHTCSYLT